MPKRALDEPELPPPKRLRVTKQDLQWLRELAYDKSVESLRLIGQRAKARAAITNIHTRGPVLPRVAPLTEDEERELAECQRRYERCHRRLEQHEQDCSQLDARIAEVEAALGIKTKRNKR
jgi:hypothetical protein